MAVLENTRSENVIEYAFSQLCQAWVTVGTVMLFTMIEYIKIKKLLWEVLSTNSPDS